MKRLLLMASLLAAPVVGYAQSNLNKSDYDQFWKWDYKIQELRDECNNFLHNEPTYRLNFDSGFYFAPIAGYDFETRVPLEYLPDTLRAWTDSARLYERKLVAAFVKQYASSPIDSIEESDSGTIGWTIHQFRDDARSASDMLTSVETYWGITRKKN